MTVASDTRLACPVCQGREWVESLTVRLASLSTCRGCGLLATTSFLSNTQSVVSLYDVTADDHRVYEADYLPSRMASFRKLLPRLERYRGSSRMLEVGSSYGDFLCFAAGRGWQVEGIEIAAYPLSVARQRGCKVHNDQLDQLDLPTGSFDVVMMWDVVEHFDNPRPIIDTCARLLRTGGALVMKTPDARALARSGGAIRKLYQQLVYPANTPEHVFHYTSAALQRMLASYGFGAFAVDDRDEWDERVISGRNALIRNIRSCLMRYAYERQWPYEFVLTAIKQ